MKHFENVPKVKTYIVPNYGYLSIPLMEKYYPYYIDKSVYICIMHDLQDYMSVSVCFNNLQTRFQCPSGQELMNKWVWGSPLIYFNHTPCQDPLTR